MKVMLIDFTARQNPLGLIDSHQEHLILYYSIEFHCDALFITTVKKYY